MDLSIDLDLGSIDKAIAFIDKYINKVKRLETELPKVIAEYGAAQAQAKFDAAAYDVMVVIPGKTDVSSIASHPSIDVHAEPTDTGWAVYAEGKEVCFVEFGAGVHFNGDGGNYLGNRPEGVVGIGEYGKGHGQQNAWGMPDGGVTYGTPASNAMYFTTQDMREKIEEEVRRILND